MLQARTPRRSLTLSFSKYLYLNIYPLLPSTVNGVVRCTFLHKHPRILQAHMIQDRSRLLSIRDRQKECERSKTKHERKQIQLKNLGLKSQSD